MRNNKQVSSGVGDTFLRSAKKKIVSTFAVLTLASAASFAAAFYFDGAGDVKALENQAVLKAEDTPDFSKETEANDEEFSITVTNAALTDNSETLRATFTSKKYETMNNSQRYMNVFVSVDDENWTNLEDARSAARSAVEEAESSQTEYTPTVYSAYVFNVQYGVEGHHDIVIPRVINYGATNVEIDGEVISTFYFQLNIVGIYSEVCKDWDNGEVINYEGIDSITIPNSVQTIEEDAFVGAIEAGVEINVEPTREEVADLAWIDGWVDDANAVNYGVTYNDEATAARPTSTGDEEFGTGVDFSIGSYTEIAGHEEYYQPMYMTYNVIDSSNNIVAENQVMQLPLTSTNSTYDAVGSTVGSTKLYKSIDIPLTAGANHRVDLDSVKFHNIYYATKQDIGGVSYSLPDIEKGALSCTPRINVSSERYITDLVDYHSGTNATYGDYLLISVIFNLNYDFYEELNPVIYNTNKAQIDSGAVRIRGLFYSIPSAYYQIVYEHNGEDISVTIPVETPIDAVEIDSGTSFGFLINVNDVGEGFSYSSIKEIYLVGFSLRMDLYRVETNAIANSSAIVTRFYTMSLLPDGKEAAAVVDLPIVMMVVYIAYFVLFIGGSVAYYFYAKNKFKNDEFRRMNTKKFLRSALLNMFGFALVLSSILFIIIRWGFLKSSVVVYNPTDVFVIIFTVAGLIFLGVTIRNIVVAIKTNRERKNKERLKIDQDKVEDGTN